MKTLGMISPAFGMVGTLIGLVFMLFNMGGSGGASAIGPAMAVALLTTFYGAVLANLIFNPLLIIEAAFLINDSVNSIISFTSE